MGHKIYSPMRVKLYLRAIKHKNLHRACKKSRIKTSLGEDLYVIEQSKFLSHLKKSMHDFSSVLLMILLSPVMLLSKLDSVLDNMSKINPEKG